jgi:hypothetical protein
MPAAVVRMVSPSIVDLQDLDAATLRALELV